MCKVLLILLVLIPELQVLARSAESIKGVWPQDLRKAAARPLLIVVVQQGPEADYRPQFAASTPNCNTCSGLGPNFVGTLVTGLLERKWVEKSERRDAEVSDLLTIMAVALQHFGTDTRLAEATAKVAQSVAWLGVPPVQISKEDTNASLSQLLDASQSGEMFVVRYHYKLIEAFSALEVDSDIALLDRQIQKNEKPARRAAFQNAPFVRHVNYFVPLHEKPRPESSDVFRGRPAITHDEDDLSNARSWAQDSAKRLVRALDHVITKSVSLVRKAVTLTREESSSIGALPRVEACGGRMRVIEKDAEGELCTKSADQPWVYEFLPIDTPEDSPKR